MLLNVSSPLVVSSREGLTVYVQAFFKMLTCVCSIPMTILFHCISEKGVVDISRKMRRLTRSCITGMQSTCGIATAVRLQAATQRPPLSQQSQVQVNRCGSEANTSSKQCRMYVRTDVCVCVCVCGCVCVFVCERERERACVILSV